MKLVELLQENTQLKTKKAITDWIKEYAPSVYVTALSIRPDMTIDIRKHPKYSNTFVELGPIDNQKLDDIPVKFGQIENGVFTIEGHPEITSWDFLPKSTRTLIIKNSGLSKIPHQVLDMDLKDLDLRYNNITSFENVQQNCQKIDLTGNPIMSLIGVEKQLKSMAPAYGFNSVLVMDFDKVKEGGLGLVLVEGMQGLAQLIEGHAWHSPIQMFKNSPFAIIAKYLGRPEDIFECQAELIHNGFEEFAKL